MTVVSQFWSADGRRVAHVCRTGGGVYYTEYFEDGKPARIQDYLSGDWPRNEVEDLAEDWVL